MTTRPTGTLHLAWKLFVRDWRAGELTVLAAALLVAVAAMTGVAFLTDRVGQAAQRVCDEMSSPSGALHEQVRFLFLEFDLDAPPREIPIPALFFELHTDRSFSAGDLVAIASAVGLGGRRPVSWACRSRRSRQPTCACHSRSPGRPGCGHERRATSRCLPGTEGSRFITTASGRSRSTSSGATSSRSSCR